MLLGGCIVRRYFQSGALLIAAALLIQLPVNSETKSDGADATAAETCAKKWLSVIDSGNYAEGWQQGATILRTAVPKNQFELQLKSVRGAFGKVLNRSVMSKQVTTTAPGAPDGKYVIIQYQTKFQKKANAIETITPMKEGSSWKVSGYYIK